MKPVSKIWRRIRNAADGFVNDRRGIAATEFAFILPLMLVAFFGAVEFSSGLAVARKVSLMSRTLANLASQNVSVTDTQLNNFFAASVAIMTPYSSTPVQSTISELYVDPNTLQARVQWSVGAAPRTVGSAVSIPTQLQTGATYLIYSEVGYQYVPTIGYVMTPSGVNLGDVAYSRPRQSTCVLYNSTACTTL